MSADIITIQRIDIVAGTTGSASVTIPSGAGVALIHIGREDTVTDLSATYNSVTMTADDTSAGAQFGGCSTFGKAYAGLSGTSQTLAVTLNNNTQYSHVFVVVYTNPDVTNMIGDFDSLDTVFTPASVVNTSDSNALHFAPVYWRASAASLATIALQSGNGQTAFGSVFENGNGNVVWASYRSGSAGGTAQVGYTFTDSGFPQMMLGSYRLNGTSSGATIVGTGAATSPPPTMSGAGLINRGKTGTGSLTAAISTISASGIRGLNDLGGAIAITGPLPTISGSGTITPPGPIAGVGNLVLSVPVITGTAIRGVKGTGALIAPHATLTGQTGPRALTGTGAITGPVPTIVGVGVRHVTGTGALIAPRALLVGNGPNTGSADFAAHPFGANTTTLRAVRHAHGRRASWRR